VISTHSEKNYNQITDTSLNLVSI